MYVYSRFEMFTQQLLCFCVSLKAGEWTRFRSKRLFFVLRRKKENKTARINVLDWTCGCKKAQEFCQTRHFSVIAQIPVKKAGH
jgi:hypothetical protein